MGLFAKFKMLFNKSVSLQPYQKNDVVSFVKLKQGMLKIGSEILVGEDYNLVSVYYNKVCDVLGAGEYKADEVSLPRLFRRSKAYFTKSGLFTPKTVTTDLYYVCTRAFTHYLFKTQDPIVVLHNDKKVKLKIEGTFTMKIVNAEKLMTALCNDYAIVRNKSAVKDISATISLKISKLLNLKKYCLQDYLTNKEMICQTLNSEINNYIEKYGLSADSFFINSIILPKKLKSELSLNQDQSNNFENSEIVKIVEERLNSLEKDLDMVYVEKTSNLNANTHEDFCTQAPETNKNSFNTNNSTDENIFIIDNDTQIKSKSNSYQTFENSAKSEQVNTSWQNTSQPNFSEHSFNNQSQPEPIIIEEVKPAEPPEPISEQVFSDDFIDGVIEKIEKRKKQKKRDKLAELLTQADVTFGQEKSSGILNIKPTKKCSSCGASLNADAKFCSKCGASTESLKICPCCGAKNFPTANACCVCKSVLD